MKDKRLFFITGAPSVGKTTVLLKAMGILRKLGLKVGGIISREVREEGVRVGFEIVDVEAGRRGCLAHINQPDGPEVGKYRVNLKDLETIGADAIQNAVKNAQIIIVDEVGPMELHSLAFKDAVAQALNSNKPVLGVIHQRARDPLINTIKARSDTEIIEVTHENREHIHNLLINKITQIIKEKQQGIS